MITLYNGIVLDRLEEILSFLVEERNKILHNPLKYFNPLYKSKLVQIERQIDNIEYTKWFLRNTNAHI